MSTRGYARSLQPLPEAVAVRGISKSAVSARFVYGTERKLAELMSRELRDLKLVALMIDGVHFAEHVVLAAVGVDERGDKHVLGLREGATEEGQWETWFGFWERQVSPAPRLAPHGRLLRERID